MPYLLCIETSGPLCSVAFSNSGTCVVHLQSEEENTHASNLFRLIETCLAQAKITFNDLDAVAISKGPGSYTGLRIGVAAAKGYCQALQIPLISLSTLTLLCHYQSLDPSFDFIIPMLDARRMEVYTAVYDRNLVEMEKPCPLILEENSYSAYIEKGKTLFIGNGATKWQQICQHPHAFFDPNCVAMAKHMCKIAFDAYLSKSFEEVAYFVPDYLKPVHITSSNK